VGKIQGTDVVSAIKAIPSGPVDAVAVASGAANPASAQQSSAPHSNSTEVSGTRPGTGSTIFEGKTDDASHGSQDIHNQAGNYTNHQDSGTHDAIDWKTNTKGTPDGSTSKVDIDSSKDTNNESLVTDKDGVYNSDSVNESKDVGTIDVDSTDPRTGKNSADIAWSELNKDQTAETIGADSYEFHQQNSHKGTLAQTFGGTEGIADADKAYAEMMEGVGKRDVGGEVGEGALQGVVTFATFVTTTTSTSGTGGLGLEMTALPTLQATSGQHVISNGSLAPHRSGDEMLDTVGQSPVLYSLGFVAAFCMMCAVMYGIAKTRVDEKVRRSSSNEEAAKMLLRHKPSICRDEM